MHIKNFSFVVDFWHENSIFSGNISRKSSILTNKMTKIQVFEEIDYFSRQKLYFKDNVIF